MYRNRPYKCAQMALGVLAAAVFAGCATGIRVAKVADGKDALTGAPWNLPMTQFTLTITRHIIECGGTIKAAVETLPSAGIVVDPDQQFVLSSRGWFSTSDITSTLSATGVSTGLNAQSTDQTGAVISNVLGTAAQILIGGAAGAAGGQNLPPAAKELCKPKIAVAVNELYPVGGKPMKEQVQQSTADLAVSTARVAVATAQATADKGNKDLKDVLVKALADQEAKQKALTTVQEKLTENLKLTTDTQIVKWPSKGSEFRRDVAYTVRQQVLDKWLENTADNQAALSNFNVYTALYDLDPTGTNWVAPAPPAVANIKVGVPVRIASNGHLLTCVSSACPTTFKMGDVLPDTTTVADFEVLQLGRMYVLPVTGGAFKSESATIILDGNGRPTSLTTSEKAAAAAGISATAKDAATQWAALPAAVRAAELAKTKGQTDQINAEAALATARETSGITGQTSTLAAQTALINAQSALESAKANAGLQQEAAGVAAQTAVLNAQAALAMATATGQVVDKTSVLGAEAALLNAEAAKLNAAAALAKAQALVP